MMFAHELKECGRLDQRGQETSCPDRKR